MTTKLPDAVLHGLSSRLKDRCPPDAHDKMMHLLCEEQDMSKTLTFIVKGYRDLEFHVMVRRVEHQPEAVIKGFTPPSIMRWQTIILVVTKQIGFLYDEPLDLDALLEKNQPPKDPSSN